MFETLHEILGEIKVGNPFGEKITLVGATKTVSADVINAAIKEGLSVVAENKVQEFREKTALISGARQDFIGHLQTNKVKYIVGKVSLIHSVDNINLAEEINKRAEKIGVIQDVLLEINIGGELSKSGFSYEDAEKAVETVSQLPHLKVKGLMAMFPKFDTVDEIRPLAEKMRSLYDGLKTRGFEFTTLSMGMSEDYKVAISCGSNTIRVGSAIFGKRNYQGENV